MKPLAWASLSVVVAFGAGWLTGASGRSAAELAAGRADETSAFLEARADLLEGQMGLVESNFGVAREQFDATAVVVRRLQTRLRETGQAERAGLLEVVLGYLTEAATKASALDPDARNAAEAALQALEHVSGRQPPT